MSGACGLAADDRLAAYDFGPDHPFSRPAGWIAGLSLLRAARVLDDGDLLAFGGPPPMPTWSDPRPRHYLEAWPASPLPGRGRPTRPRRPASGWSGTTGRSRAWTRRAGWSAGATIAAVDTVAGGDLAHAFALAPGPAPRPAAPGGRLLPGQRRGRGHRPLHPGLLLRVLYVDLDAHHGDGVQAAFYDDPRVCTVSLHETGRYLFRVGEVHELGRPPGWAGA